MHDQTGHRSRMRDRFRKEGLDSFEDVHVLELLLQYSIPRIDTKPLARELLNRFGSFCAVLEASEESLTQVHGIGVQTATFLRLKKKNLILNRTCLTPLLSTANLIETIFCELKLAKAN